MAQRALELKTCGCSCGMHKYNANIISNYKIAVNRNTAKKSMLRFCSIIILARFYSSRVIIKYVDSNIFAILQSLFFQLVLLFSVSEASFHFEINTSNNFFCRFSTASKSQVEVFNTCVVSA